MIEEVQRIENSRVKGLDARSKEKKSPVNNGNISQYIFVRYRIKNDYLCDLVSFEAVLIVLRGFSAAFVGVIIFPTAVVNGDSTATTLAATFPMAETRFVGKISKK